jgi:hypothetical protein
MARGGRADYGLKAKASWAASRPTYCSARVGESGVAAPKSGRLLHGLADARLLFHGLTPHGNTIMAPRRGSGMLGRARGSVRSLVALRAAGSPWLKRIGLGGSGMNGLGVRGELHGPERGFWLIVAASEAETDSGVRVSGIRMGWKWFRLLGLRGFPAIRGWR